jgi:hypothetical protein
MGQALKKPNHARGTAFQRVDPVNGLLRSAVSSAITHNVPGVRIREPNSQVCPSSEVLQCPCVAARAHCVDREMVAIGRRQTMYKRRSFVLPEAVRIAL